MLSPEITKERKSFKFSWELIGYDLCRLTKIRSPIFRVNFEVTEWFMELDLSKLQNAASYIPFRLQRKAGIGACEVALDVNISVKFSPNEVCLLRNAIEGRKFSEDGLWEFNLDLPSTVLESKTKDENWLTSKTLNITVEMKSPEYTDPEFPKNYWRTEASKGAVLNDLKKLCSNDSEPKYHDLVVKVPGREFQLHKCILKARWPKLASILEISKPSTEVETRELSDIPDDMLKHLLNFAYCGDLNFMHQLHEMKNGLDVFDLVRKYNFYRLNDQISQLSPECRSSQLLQSYRTSVEMKLTNVTSKENALGDFRTCEIPLKPKILPVPEKPIEARKVEKFYQHIRFMDLRVYIDKGPFGYNWLFFSIVLGKLPKKGPVTIKCRLYVVDESNVKHFLTEQNLLFDLKVDENIAVHFKTPFSKEKIITRYQIISEPVITLEDLIDEQKCLVRKRVVNKPSKVLRQDKSHRVKSSKQDDEIIWFDPQTGKPVAKKGASYNLESDDVMEANGNISLPESEKPVEEKDDSSNLESEEPDEKDIHLRFEIKLADGEEVYDMRHGECIFMYEGDKKIFRDLKSMCEDEFTDIELKSENRKIKAHKAVLAARSPTISSAIRRTKTNLLDIAIKPEYLHAFVHYLYTGHLPEVPVDDIDHLLSVAEEYKVNCLADLLREQKNELKLVDVAAAADDDDSVCTRRLI